uniref:Pre-mRNA splicing Prp18-interacting factor n=1 Tax=Tanacetum cinerariifolium TaxID=118510 RepID=A0A6L2JP13_TANCI|nr:hypothetical protein [Tanacetum cinerariifolium]
MSLFYEFTCYGCRGPSDTPLCYRCICEQCGNILIEGACLKCNSRAENSFNYDPNPESFNEVQSIFNLPPQSHYNIYLCQICESNSHYGFECSQPVSLVYEPEPCYNQSFGNNAYPHDLPGVTPLIDHHCCYKCGDSLDGFFCNQCTYEFYGNGAHYGYNCPPHVPFIKTLPSFPQKNLCCEDCGGSHETFQSIAITLDLPIVKPEDFLRMEDEHLDTIPETESNEFIKSSVENLILNPNDLMPPGMENDDYDSESFQFDIPSSIRPPAKPPDDDEVKPNSRIVTVKVVGDISKQYVPMPRRLPTQPTLVSNQEKSPHLLSHRGLKAFQLSSESPMMIYGGNIPILDVPFLYFYPP